MLWHLIRCGVRHTGAGEQYPSARAEGLSSRPAEEGSKEGPPRKADASGVPSLAVLPMPRISCRDIGTKFVAQEIRM